MDGTQKASSQEIGEKVIIPLFMVLAYMMLKESHVVSYRLFHLIPISFTLILEIEMTPKTRAEN